MHSLYRLELSPQVLESSWQHLERSRFWDSGYLHSHPLSGLHLGKTKLVCFLQTSPFLFPKPLFCLMLPPIWSLASSFLSLPLILDSIWKDSILWTAIAPLILEIHWHLPFRCSCFLLAIRLLLLWSHTVFMFLQEYHNSRECHTLQTLLAES